MKITYDPETDTMYIVLVDKPVAMTDEITHEGDATPLLIDYDEDSNVVAIEIDDASKYLDNPFEIHFDAQQSVVPNR